MPSTYRFLVFSDVNDMRDASAKRKIRRHAMKDIGATRRRLRGRKIPLEFSPRAVCSGEEKLQPSKEHFPSLDDKALYDSYIRNMTCKMDPFDTASVPIDITAQGLLRYFVYYSSNFPNNFTYTLHIDKLMQSAIKDNMFMHCILGAAASRVYYVENVDLPAFRAREAFSTQESVRLLQNDLGEVSRLSLGSKERLVNCALYLGAGAIYRYDHWTARIHVKAAAQLAELMGGVKELRDPQVLLRIISLDDLLSCTRLRPCTILPTYDPGPLPLPRDTSKRSRERAEKLPCGFMKADQDVLPGPLRALVLQVIECHRSKCLLEASTSNTAADNNIDRQRLKLRTLAARNRLLSFTANNSRTESLRIALILCTLLPPTDLRQIRTAHGIAQRLKAVLKQQTGSTWRNAEHLLFWCLLIGYFSAEPGVATQTWFSLKICEVIRRLGDQIGVHAGPKLLADLIAFQEQYLFDTLVLRPYTERLAHDSLERLLHLF